MTTPVADPKWSLLIPVKDGRRAKSRLGLSHDAQRGELMVAFARDAISAALAVPGIEVFVVGDPSTLTPTVTGLDAAVVPDEGDGDLNRALTRAAAHIARRGRGTAVLLADLPCLRTEDLVAAFEDGDDRRYVADAAGTGTTLLIVPDGSPLDPHFGPGSAQAHSRSGARALGAALTSLRLDVDTTADLRAALLFGVGPHTARIAPGLL